MIAAISAHPYLFWLTLGGVLLVAEMLGTGGWLLWCAVAAVITGVASWVAPLSIEWQGVCFAVLTVLSAFLWWRWLTRRNSVNRPANALNQRGQALIGRELVLDEALVDGRGNARVGDSRWPVVADTSLPAGSRVVVIAIEGITLRVKAR
ncbi:MULTISPECIES: NfeD family protein [Tenebrionibacter/Tenebrionicola group]|jgi:membrane protein implicated in regulation of membrane protease activity|uniref:NfeD family protein n=2 Tax=Tenebrionibacter/Tenebrionicola group TaxID=2969848 RepID=A0A8K0XWR8_9ENTR|nr:MULTISPECIES: NfeD family protein [Tenebrionibacter/Tenebrionicola group]MBK4715740.1 NfeD family protein [Tenebrionibacter intestinalis]MBV5096320.1 NfeD family protein [Tenebrionicola larvae]